MFWDFEKNVKTYVEFQRPLNHSGPKVSSGKSTTSNIVSDVVEKKHRLVVEVESLVSSSKKLRRVDVNTCSGVVVVEKKGKKSTNFQNKHSSDLLTGYSNNTH